MIISFFEEFPSKENLDKIKLINWPFNLFLASKNLGEFKKYKKKIKSKFLKNVIYWPILEKKEGYWISPFSKQKALRRIFQEIEKTEIKVMIDAEIPISINPKLFLTELINFPKNKKIIKRFLEKNKNSYTTESNPSKMFEQIYTFLGMSYNPKKYKNVSIKMIYNSIKERTAEEMNKEVSVLKKQYSKNLKIALGTIAKGIQENEPILSHIQLKKDLEIIKKHGIDEVVIFRLGGLNKEYVKIIKQFT